MEKWERVWNYLVEMEIATEEELQLFTIIHGISEDTLNQILFVNTGYRSMDQLEEMNED